MCMILQFFVNMRQTQPVWRTKSYNFKREAWVSTLKKSSPTYLGPKISTLFWCTGWAWNRKIIFRFASIRDRACFISKTYRSTGWLATGRWFSPGTAVHSTNKTDRHDITEVLLKVVLNVINQTKPYFLVIAKLAQTHKN
jgi:hypothetical protein